MKKILLLITVLFTGCSLHRAVLVSNPNNKKDVDPINNGFVCFRSLTDMGNELEIDVKNEISGETFRLWASRRKNSVNLLVYEKEFVEESVSKNILISQLPEGGYKTTRLYLTNPDRGYSQRGQKLVESRFTITKGKMTYLGDYNFNVKWIPMLGFKSISIKGEDRIDSLKSTLSGVTHYGITDMTIQDQFVDLKLK